MVYSMAAVQHSHVDLVHLGCDCKQSQYMKVYTTGDLNAYGWLCRLLGELLLRPCCAEGFTGE